MPYFRGANLQATRPVIGLLTEIGRAHDVAPATVALRWLIQQGAVPIPGAKNGRQASTNAAALRIELDDAEQDALSAATRRWRD
jgi:diketogulonate reductase-like aldo/keto reductase